MLTPLVVDATRGHEGEVLRGKVKVVFSKPTWIRVHYVDGKVAEIFHVKGETSVNADLGGGVTKIVPFEDEDTVPGKKTSIQKITWS
jgi:hypothetical protein